MISLGHEVELRHAPGEKLGNKSYPSSNPAVSYPVTSSARVSNDGQFFAYCANLMEEIKIPRPL